jgi:hypothetical protein
MELGESGEKEVHALFEKVLFGHAHRYMGRADLGRDLSIQFCSTSPARTPIDLLIQVKAGSSYVEDCGRNWRILNIDERRFSEWRRSRTPVVLVWVDTDFNNRGVAYWKLINRNTSRQYLYISKYARICPVTRFDLPLKIEEFTKLSDALPQYRLLPVGLSAAIRPIAKQYYRNVLMRESPINPLLGPVKFTWKGWRHITNQRRNPKSIFTSLQLLPVALHLIKYPGKLFGFRRLCTAQRGKVVSESRLIAFDYPDVALSYRPNARVVIVLRERITYPATWRSSLLRENDVVREVTFESIYEKLY